MANVAIVDKLRDKGIPFASVVGLDREGNQTGLGVTANDKGMAAIDNYDWLTRGVEIVEVSSVGYSQARVNLAQQDLDFTVFLNTDEKELGGVIVTSVMKNKNLIMIVIMLLFLILVLAYAASKPKK